MADDDLTIFGNLPRKKRQDGYENEDEARTRVRSALSFQNYREGPLKPRPSGRGGATLGPDGKPIVPGGGGTTSVWSAADATANGMTLSNGGLTVTTTTSTWQTVRSTVVKTSGKLYIEFLANANNGDGFQIFGLASAGFSANSLLGNSNYSGGVSPSGNNVSTGFTANYNLTLVPATNDVWGLAVDFSSGNAWVARNNVWASSSNPGTGTLPILSFVLATVGPLFAGLSFARPGEIWTLQATAASQKYAPPSGFTAWDGGTALSPSDAYLARTVGGNEGGNAANIATLIDGLVSDGVWAKLDALYILAQQNATDAKLNLIGTSYSLTGAPPFTAYQGFYNFLTAATFLTTGFNPITAPSPHFTQNSASLGAWADNTALDASVIMGADALNHLYDIVSGNFYARINNGSTNGTASSAASGLFVGDRSVSAAVEYFVNGVDLGAQGGVSSPPNSVAFTIGGYGGTATNQTLSAAFIGASLGSAGQLALYNRLNTYMTAVAPSSVWSAADAAANGFTLSNGGSTYTNNSVTTKSIRGTVSHASGKYYVEFFAVATGTNHDFGVANSTFNSAIAIGASNYSGAIGYSGNTVSAGFTSNYTTIVYASTGQTIQLAVDFDAGKIWYGLNNVWINSSNPAAGTLPVLSFVPATVGSLFPAAQAGIANDVWTLRGSSASQTYAPPSGFAAWDAAAAPPPTSVWSATDATANGMTLSNGGLTVTPSGAASWGSIRGSIAKTSGKLYVEFAATSTAMTDPNGAFGLASASFNPTGAELGDNNYSGCFFPYYIAGNVSAGFTFISVSPNGVAPAPNDVWALCVDFSTGNTWLARNNVFGGNPATGSSPGMTFVPATVGALFPALSLNGVCGVWTLQATAASQKYAPPAGFTPWG